LCINFQLPLFISSIADCEKEDIESGKANGIIVVEPKASERLVDSRETEKGAS
jgi:hypothetical protein